MSNPHALPLDALGRPIRAVTHTHGGHPHSHVHPDAAASGPAPRWRLRGTFLPGGEEREAWIVDGRLTFEPVADADTLATGVWILPGLVDAHCHVGLDAHGAVDAATSERQALTDRDAGALLLRDAGSPADTRWIDGRDDLPRIIRAGRHIARPRRYIRNFAAEVEPDALVDEVRTQAARGDGWVKLVGDWIDRDTGDLAPLWPVDVVRRAIDAAHGAGARVTAHCFEERSVAELVAAGIDGIEHGTGLDDATIEAMAARGVSLVPTMVNLETFPGIADAGEAKFPRYAVHMRALHGRRFDTMARAVEAGVPVFAGTDAGGSLAHGLIGEEVALLARVGGAEFALGAASWRARDWLGVGALGEGSSADLLILGADPRVDLRAVRAPLFVVLRGRVVR